MENNRVNVEIVLRIFNKVTDFYIVSLDKAEITQHRAGSMMQMHFQYSQNNRSAKPVCHLILHKFKMQNDISKSNLNVGNNLITKLVVRFVIKCLEQCTFRSFHHMDTIYLTYSFVLNIIF